MPWDVIPKLDTLLALLPLLPLLSLPSIFSEVVVGGGRGGMQNVGVRGVVARFDRKV